MDEASISDILPLFWNKPLQWICRQEDWNWGETWEKLQHKRKRRVKLETSKVNRQNTEELKVMEVTVKALTLEVGILVRDFKEEQA